MLTNKNRWLKWIGALLCVVLLGCEDSSDSGDDPDLDPVSISGNCRLVVENFSRDTATVYFDGDFIGRIGEDSVRTWSIPSGTHTVTIDNAEQDFTDEKRRTRDLAPGETWTISFDAW